MATASPEAPKSIEIKDIGPIKLLTIPLIEGGGVTVLTGSNGSGKSHALEACSRLAGDDKIKLPIRDGAKRGTIDGCGVHVVFGGRTNAIGELEVESIEGKFNLPKLVDPGIADPAAADAARIKAILKLHDEPVDDSVWLGLFNNDKAYFEAMGIELTGDPVTDAGRVKRAIESQARKLEADADRLGGQYATRMGDVQEYGEEVERDRAKLDESVEFLVKAKATLDEQRKAAEAQAWRRKEAQEKLAALPESNLNVLVADAQTADSKFTAAARECDEIKSAIIELEEKLADANREKDLAYATYKTAEKAVEIETQRIHEREQFDKILAADTLYCPSDDAIADAQKMLDEARARVELGTKARLADENAAKALELKAAENTARKEALRLRDAAKSTDEILSDMVGKLDVGLTVHEGRLSIQTDRGTDPEPFADLSQGERWKVALDIGVLRVGANGILPVSQEAWESLDPEARGIVAQHAKSRGVFIITAEAASGPLRAEAYSNGIAN